MVATNGVFDVFNTAGQQVLSETLTQFWTNAGVKLTGTPFSSRIEYDPNSQQWVMVGLDTNLVAGIEQGNNNVLLAVSDTASPTGLWTSFTIPSTSGTTTTTQFATSVALGIDLNAANITVDMSNLTESIISIPTVSLFPGGTTTPTDAGFTAIANVTSESATGVTELSLQPATNFGQDEATDAVFGIDENVANAIDRFDIASEGSATVKAILAGPTPVSVSPATETNPPAGGSAGHVDHNQHRRVGRVSGHGLSGRQRHLGRADRHRSHDRQFRYPMV